MATVAGYMNQPQVKTQQPKISTGTTGTMNASQQQAYQNTLSQQPQYQQQQRQAQLQPNQTASRGTSNYTAAERAQIGLPPAGQQPPPSNGRGPYVMSPAQAAQQQAVDAQSLARQQSQYGGGQLTSRGGSSQPYDPIYNPMGQKTAAQAAQLQQSMSMQRGGAAQPMYSTQVQDRPRDDYGTANPPASGPGYTPTPPSILPTPSGMGTWSPQLPQSPQYSQGQLMGNPATRSGGLNSFFGGDPNIFNPDAYKDNDAMTPNYLSSVLPAATLAQNAFQYSSDFNEALRRWNLEYGTTKEQNAYQQQLGTRQQQMAEWQAQQQANQWSQLFGHTQNMDMLGYGLSKEELAQLGTQINNNFTVGMDQNQASRDVANIYGNSNMYQSDQQLQGTKYQSDQQLQGTRYASDAEKVASMYGADAGVKQAGLYSDAQRYQADRGYQEAGLYSAAQRYGADQGLAGERYTADQALAQAGLYSNAQRYGADQGLAGQRYQADQGLAEAGLYSGAQRFNTEAQERMNAALMQNNALVANIGAYGRSAAPQANWSRNW